VAAEPGIEPLRAGRQDAAGERVASEVDGLQDRVAIDRVVEGLAHAPIVEGLDSRVESVEAQADHRPLDVLLAGRGDGAKVIARRQRAVLEAAAGELVVHRVELVAPDAAVGGAGRPGRGWGMR